MDQFNETYQAYEAAIKRLTGMAPGDAERARAVVEPFALSIWTNGTGTVEIITCCTNVTTANRYVVYRKQGALKPVMCCEIRLFLKTHKPKEVARGGSM